MAAFTISFLVTGLASPVVGRFVDRHGARLVICAGAAMAGLGFALLSLMDNLWYFYILYAVIGVGMAALGPVPTSAVVSNWFRKRRGLAIGIMSTGVGAGGLALAPLIGGYLIPNFGWRVSYLAMAVLTWVLIIPLALFVIKTKPEDMGLYPDGARAAEAAGQKEAWLPTAEGVTLRMALSTSAFWLITISFLLSQFSQCGVVQSQVPHLQDIGFPVTMAAGALGVLGLMSAISKFGFGMLCDWVTAKYACAIGFGLQVAGIIILLGIGPTSSPAIIWLYAIVMGLGAGSWLPTMSMVVSTNFGLAYYGSIFGLVSLAERTGVATGPLVAGYTYDVMHIYRWVFIFFLALYAIAIPAILVLRCPKYLGKHNSC